MNTNDLIREITSCPFVKNPPDCANIISSQKNEAPQSFQLPEPWSGNLESAPILFLSSNPSHNNEEDYPTNSWSVEKVEDFFTNRFRNGIKEWIRKDIRVLLKNGEYSDWVRYYAAVKEPAGRAHRKDKKEMRGGIDYVLSEIVHCKSKKEKGVKEAWKTCRDFYLRKIIEASLAKLIVSYGEHSIRAIKEMFINSSNENKYCAEGPIEINGRQRFFVFFPHPSSYGNKKEIYDRVFKELFEKGFFLAHSK